MGALKSCQNMARHGNIRQSFNEDISLLLTVGKLYEFVRDPHDPDPSQFFHHTVRLNAVRLEGQWYEIQKLPSGHFRYSDITELVNQVQILSPDDVFGFGYEEVVLDPTAEDGDGLIFNPHEWKIKIADVDFEFPFVCSHKREHAQGEVCPGQVSECNGKGTCVFGECYCIPGYGYGVCDSK